MQVLLSKGKMREVKGELEKRTRCKPAGARQEGQEAKNCVGACEVSHADWARKCGVKETRFELDDDLRHRLIEHHLPSSFLEFLFKGSKGCTQALSLEEHPGAPAGHGLSHGLSLPCST